MATGKRSSEKALQKVLGQGANVNARNPLEVHDPKVGSLISYEGTTTADGAGDGSSLIDSVLTTKPDYDGHWVVITSGPYVGQCSDITAATTGGTVTAHTAFDGQILRGTQFVILAMKALPAEVAALAAAVAAIATALGNPTGDMSAVTQGEAASLAAYLINAREHYRAHDQTRICLIVPNEGELASDLPNTAIKAELDKIGSVTVLDEAGVDAGQEDWGVYDLIVVGSDGYDGGFTVGNLDDLITVKVPVMVCNAAVAEHLLMGTDPDTSSANTDNEWCKTIYNRVMYLVFAAVGAQVIFSEPTVSDQFNMSDDDLIELLLMTSLTGDDNTKTVVGWLPMESPAGVVYQLNDGSDIPAGRLFAGCFVNADKLNDQGKLLLRRIARNFTQASITPSITLKAAAQQVAAILVDTGTTIPALLATIDDYLDTEIAAILAAVDTEVANVLLDTQIRKVASGASGVIGAAASKYIEIDSGTNGAEILAVIINGVVTGFDWTLDTYVPTADDVATPAAADKRDSIAYANTDTEGGLLKPFAIAYNAFLKFTNDSAGDQTINDVVVVYRSRAAITIGAWT